jgi:hypothetical protein
VLAEAFDPEFVKQYPVRHEKSSPEASEPVNNTSYTAEDAAQIEARLKALGYIE